MPLSTQFFDQLTTRFERDGIPNTRSEVAETVRFVTGQDVTRYLSGDIAMFEDIDAIRDAYSEHRSSHRIAAFRDQVATVQNYLFLGRSTQQQPSLMWPEIWDSLARIDQMYRNGSIEPLKNMPWVISEEGRFDRAPMNNDTPEQHATLHVLSLEGMNEVIGYGNSFIKSMTNGLLPEGERVRNVSTAYFNAERYEEVIADSLADLIAQGWEIITREFSYSHQSVSNFQTKELPIAAIAPEEIGRHAVLLMNMTPYLWSSTMCAEVMLELYSRLPEVTVEEPTDDSLSVITIIEQTRAAVSTIRQNITQTRSSVDSREREIDGLLTSLQNQTRLLTDERRQLQQMELGVERLALETVQDLSLLPTLCDTMRQLQSSELDTSNNEMVLKLVTHAFGMRVPPGRYRRQDHTPVEETEETSLYIPPITITINFNKRSFSEAIRFDSGDGQRWHPHVSVTTNVCWGSAATPLAEAWARRDWESLIRIVLGWFTQYDRTDAYTRIHTIIEYRGRAPRTGWLLPDEDGNVPQAVHDDATTVEIEVEYDDEIDEHAGPEDDAMLDEQLV